MSNSYVLVNPYIKGEFNNTIKSKNSVEAGKEFYKSLSEHFNNAIPKFYFTIQKGVSGKGKLYHFQVKEKLKKNNVSFTLEPYNILGEVDFKSFTNRLNNFKNKLNEDQEGGKKKKHESESESDSDSDLSSSSDNYKKVNNLFYNVNQPIYYWWYDPSIYRLDSYFIPTFYTYVTPIIEVVLNP